jgi:hypothetical protein
MTKLGLDLDGVLYEWQRVIYDEFVRQGKFTGTFREFWLQGGHKDGHQDCVKYHVTIPTYYSATAPRKSAMNFLKWADSRFELYYITTRPENAVLTTQQYLRRYDFPQRENLFITDDKLTLVRLLKIDYFVDDLERNIVPLSTVTTSVIYARPWNEYLWELYPTVHSFPELRQFLEEQCPQPMSN